MRRLALLLLALLLLALPGLAPAAAPADFLPPAPPWQGASEALVVPASHPWVTPSELTGLTDSPTYDETLA